VGFADFTVTQRFPKVAATAIAMSETSRARRAIEALLASIIGGGRLDVSLLARPTPFWARYVDHMAGATWANLSFFELEFVFYHALNSIAGYFEDGRDIFRAIRQGAREAAVTSLAGAVHGDRGSSRDDLSAALWLALLANESDYSQLAAGQGRTAAWSERLLIDERPALLDSLLRIRLGTGVVHVIADNAGPELMADLLLADTLLDLADDVAVTIHCKPWPMFVSDALISDVEESIGALRVHDLGPLRAIGQRLHRASDMARLRVEHHVAWGEPRHFDGLEDGLSQELRRGLVVIAKGDLNYRRFVGDRDWPIGTPAATASGGVPFPAFALRVLKSDALVGIGPAIAARAEAISSTWRTDSTHALVQRLGHIDPP
jgi:Damage-control phosphatase ARMT1-like domain